MKPLKEIVITQKDLQDAMKTNIEKSKKTYTRKKKHKKDDKNRTY